MSKSILLFTAFVFATGDAMEWRWSKENANLENCVKKHLKDFDVQMTPAERSVAVVVRTKDGQKLLSFDAHSETSLTCANDMLFIAEVHPIATGCHAVAFDLKSGKQVWKTRLKGLGSIKHSKYRNKANIQFDGAKVIVYGNESSGRYVEYLDVSSGKTTANKKYDADFESLPR